LLLLDEFGTGSDPELGGALAEVFFEELYKKSAFAVIATHYSNIKLKANSLKNAENGCMLFDSETLKPKYEFAIGQPGSSFTFEVAKMNGIKSPIIEAAKGLLDDKKVKLDRLLNELQKEKNYLERLTKEHLEAQENAENARVQFIEKREHYENRLKSQQKTIDEHNKQLSSGKKMLQFIDKFNLKSRKKDANQQLMEEIRNYMKLEKSKTEVKIQQEKTEIQKKKVTVAKQRKQEELNQHLIKIGSSVQILGTNRIGIVDKVKEKHMEVIFGNAKIKVEREKLRFLK
jgi:DNA mismatch repair protein MutS2